MRVSFERNKICMTYKHFNDYRNGMNWNQFRMYWSSIQKKKNQSSLCFGYFLCYLLSKKITTKTDEFSENITDWNVCMKHEFYIVLTWIFQALFKSTALNYAVWKAIIDNSWIT